MSSSRDPAAQADPRRPQGLCLDRGYDSPPMHDLAVMALERRLDPAAVSVVEPLACVLRGQAPCDIQERDVVLIVGAGPIGLLHLLSARVRNPSEILVSEPSDARRAQAAKWGADRVVDPASEDLGEVLGEGADEDCRAALDLVTSGAVDAGRLVTARRPLAEAAAAFEAARAGEELKVVIEP